MVYHFLQEAIYCRFCFLYIRKSHPVKRWLFCLVTLSGLGWSANGACFGTRTAFNAGFRIDLELSVAFTDGRNGALSGTGTAADAVFRNFVSHDSYLQSFLCT